MRVFEEQGTVTWVGSSSRRPPGSTGKAREVDEIGERVFVSWGYDKDVPRGEQPDAECWVSMREIVPGFLGETGAELLALSRGFE